MVLGGEWELEEPGGGVVRVLHEMRRDAAQGEHCPHRLLFVEWAEGKPYDSRTFIPQVQSVAKWAQGPRSGSWYL